MDTIPDWKVIALEERKVELLANHPQLEGIQLHDIVFDKTQTANVSCQVRLYKVIEINGDEVKIEDDYDHILTIDKESLITIRRAADISDIEVDFTRKSMMDKINDYYSRLYDVSHVMADNYKQMGSTTDAMEEWLNNYSHYRRKSNLYAKINRVFDTIFKQEMFTFKRKEDGGNLYPDRVKCDYYGFVWMVKNRKKLEDMFAEIDKAIDMAPQILEEFVLSNFKKDLEFIKKQAKNA